MTMRRRTVATVHPMGCTCKACTPKGGGHPRAGQAIKAATRALFLIAAVLAIPFIVALALSNARGERQ